MTEQPKEEELQSLIRQRNALQLSILAHQKAIVKEKEIHKAIDSVIRTICQHDWRPDMSYDLAPFDRRNKICSICDTVDIGVGK